MMQRLSHDIAVQPLLFGQLNLYRIKELNQLCPLKLKWSNLLIVALCLLSKVPCIHCKHHTSGSYRSQTTQAPICNWDNELRPRYGNSKATRIIKLPPDFFRGPTQRLWDIYDWVSLRGGSDIGLLAIDRLARSVAYWLGAIVTWQSLGTLLMSRDHLFDELATKFLSAESATAVKTVRTIISQFSDHGVIDVFKMYPPKDVIASILTLAKLHRVISYVEDDSPGEEWDDLAILEQLARYAVFANAAYGWKMDLAFRGKINRSDLQTLLTRTGIEPEDVVVAEWESKTHRPAYFIVRDHKQEKIVLCIRGTWSANDLLTDLCCTAEHFETGTTGRYKAHHGMLKAALGVANAALDFVTHELDKYPNYSLVLVGHSLGAGVASVLGSIWHSRFPCLQVFGFGMPCVGPLNAFPTRCPNTFAVIGEGDPFSRLSLGHIADLSMAIAHLCEQEELRTLIALRTDGPLQDIVCQDLDWCMDTMKKLRVHMKGEQLFPPGRILYMKRTVSAASGKPSITLRQVPPTHFQDLRLHPRMLDISRHVPSLYESLLQIK